MRIISQKLFQVGLTASNWHSALVTQPFQEHQVRNVFKTNIKEDLTIIVHCIGEKDDGRFEFADNDVD